MGLFADTDPAFLAVYAEESAMVESAEAIAEALEHSGVTRAELAERLGVHKSEITNRLRGERNITVRKLAATLHALGAELHIEAKLPAQAQSHAAPKWVSHWTTVSDEHYAHESSPHTGYVFATSAGHRS